MRAMPAVSKGTASNAIGGDDAKSLLLRQGGGGAWPPARTMKPRGRNAREPVAFAAAAVDA